MALDITKPPKKAKGTPPVTTTAPSGQENTRKPEAGATAPLNFKPDAAFVKDWKVYCVTNDISQIDLFKKMFEYWKENHGG